MSDKPQCVIVDDDRDFLSFAQRTVDRVWPDARLVSFDRSMSALEFVALNSADLVVTDFRMPDFDGLQLTSAIHTVDPAVRVVVMSGQPEAQQLALARGADGFVAKHAFAQELERALRGFGYLA